MSDTNATQTPAPELVTINIDGKEIRAEKGANLVDVAEASGIEIPHYCYHPHLTVSGNCRMCLVEMGTPLRNRETGEAELNEDGSAKIGFFPKPAIACSTQISEGLHVKTQSPLVKECREGVMEFLLVNHPLDCPICDQAGECKLQEYATDYGKGYSRFIEDKNVKPKRTELGPRVVLDDERCILCSRCVRFSKEVAGDDVLGFTDHGSHTTLGCYPGKKLENNYSLNTVDICPVGALTSTDFRFKMRPWFLKPTHSICTESSVGIPTEVWSREGTIYRITPRRNDAVNDSWMPDSGRILYKVVDAEDRISAYQVEGEKVSYQTALENMHALLSENTGNIAYVVNGKLSVEEQFLLKQLSKPSSEGGSAPAAGSVYPVAHLGENDGLLLSEDRTPNVRGGLMVGLYSAAPETTEAALAPLKAAIAAGEVNTIVSFGEDVHAAGISADHLNIIYLGTTQNETAAHANVVLPWLSVFETSGSYVNQQFRLQKFNQAVPGLTAKHGVQQNTAVLKDITAALAGTGALAPQTMAELWKDIAANNRWLEDLTWKTIPTEGVLLDVREFADTAFPETGSLHYKHEGAAAAGV